MTKSDLKKLGFKKYSRLLYLDLKHGFCLFEGEGIGVLYVYELNHPTLRFDNIEDIKLFIKLVNK